MIKRRTFVKNMAALSALSMLKPSHIFASAPKKKMIGIQLYTIRDLVKEDFIGTLNKLSNIGYNSIEAAGYADGKFYGYAPKEYKQILNDMGLTPMSSHSGINTQNAGQIAEDTLSAGMPYLVLPWISQDWRTADGYKKLAEDLNSIGETCKKAGLSFAYHNHDFEFVETEGIIPYNMLLDQTNPDYVTMQLDLYWMAYAGQDPLDYFKAYPGRFELWHVKDMDDTESRGSTEIGSGILDITAYFKNRKLSGMQHYFVEQEAFSMDPMDSVAMSFKYLKKF